MTHPGRLAEVMARLDLVCDPELDTPVTELGFITGVGIAPDGVVAVDFRLPTYWCAANFAFMMADDMRREIAALPWVTGVAPRLGEHMYAERINEGVAGGLSFQAVFADAAEGDLHLLRRTFLAKAFQRRQEALLRHLLDGGMPPDFVVALTMDALARLRLDEAGDRLRDRYRQRRDLPGPWSGGSTAIVGLDGAAIGAGALPDHLRALRRVATNAEFNGALCSGLLAARFAQPGRPQGEPTLLDFARMAP